MLIYHLILYTCILTSTKFFWNWIIYKLQLYDKKYTKFGIEVVSYNAFDFYEKDSMDPHVFSI